MTDEPAPKAHRSQTTVKFTLYVIYFTGQATVDTVVYAAQYNCGHLAFGD